MEIKTNRLSHDVLWQAEKWLRRHIALCEVDRTGWDDYQLSAHDARLDDHGLEACDVLLTVLSGLGIVGDIGCGVEAPVFVTVYDVVDEYGGPEEGGWWFRAGRVTAVHTFDTAELADWFTGRLRTQSGAKELPATGVGLRYTVGDEPGRNFPEFAPSYE
jgi:hypothetical protein